MNKNTYMEQLKKALELQGVGDIDEILEEYDQHFSMKRADGYTEEEIAARLDSPTSVAQQFGPASSGQTVSSGNKLVLSLGLGFLDLVLGMVYIVLYAWVIVFGGVSIACLGGGLSLVLGIRWNEMIIPYTPYLGGLVLGIALLALCVLTAIATIYLHLYLVQLCKVYLRWHKNTLSPQKLPPLSLQPALSPVFRRRLRKAALLSALVFGISLTSALFILMAYANFEPFWHKWNWFH